MVTVVNTVGAEVDVAPESMTDLLTELRAAQVWLEGHDHDEDVPWSSVELHHPSGTVLSILGSGMLLMTDGGPPARTDSWRWVHASDEGVAQAVMRRFAIEGPEGTAGVADWRDGHPPPPFRRGLMYAVSVGAVRQMLSGWRPPDPNVISAQPHINCYNIDAHLERRFPQLANEIQSVRAEGVDAPQIDAYSYASMLRQSVLEPALKSEDTATLRAAYQLIEEILDSPDSSLQDALFIRVLDNLDMEVAAASVQEHGGPRLKATLSCG